VVIKREIKTSLPLSIEEQAMLQRLAEAEGISTAQWLRGQVRKVHSQRYGAERLYPTSPTLRGLIADLTGRAHYTTENIAERMGIEVDAVLAGLKRMERKGLVQQVAGSGAGSTWECMPNSRDAEAQAGLAEKKGLDLEAPLE
jgi:DNA-binding MarR family transcriptional regulator